MNYIILASGYAIAVVFVILFFIMKKKKNKLQLSLQNNDTSLYLYDIAFSESSFMEKLKNISIAIMSRLEFDYVSFFILDSDKNVGIISSNVPDYDHVELNVFSKDLLLNKTNPVILHSEDKYLPHGVDRYIKYVYFIPLINDGVTIGGILLEKETKHNIDKIETMVFDTIVSALSKAFTFFIFAYNLNESAYKDALTGCMNRHALDNINNELEGKYTAVMCDIDFFKKVNDTYGHDAGDDAIQYFADILLNSVRLGDVVLRMGGEEFLMLLKDVDCDMIISRINNIRRTIEENTIISNEHSINLTASFGLCDTSISSNLDELIKLSDKALYYSKENGRNRATIYRENL